MYRMEKTSRTASCAYCGRVLTTGFHPTCHVCGLSYCYAHYDMHKPHKKEEVEIPA